MIQMRDSESKKELLKLIMYFNHFRSTKNSTMIEIGSYAGESTSIFATYFKKVIAIDPFINNYDKNAVACREENFDEVYSIFLKVVKKNPNILHIKQLSNDAFSLIKEPIHFVYIDGNHTYDQVKMDICNYINLIPVGCFIGGHDYVSGWEGVINAVNEVLGTPDALFNDGSWIKRKV